MVKPRIVIPTIWVQFPVVTPVVRSIGSIALYIYLFDRRGLYPSLKFNYWHVAQRQSR